MNKKTNVIKWLAIVTMTVDHIGYILFPQLIWLRLVGRIAFPCFLYTTIEGVKQTRNFYKYFLRLLLTGVLSIFVTQLAGNIWNILFSLAIFALTLHDRRFFIPGLLLSNFTEYGAYGFLMGWGIKVAVDHQRWAGVCLLVLLHLTRIHSIQFYALLALIPILLPFEMTLPRFPKWLGYFYYPLHLLLLYLIKISW